MAEKRPDRRVARTRAALKTAFIDLMLERGFESLTAADVAERANVGRSSLYAHFAGLDGLMRESIDHPSSQLAAALSEDMTPERMVPLLAHFHSQRRLNRVFFAPPLRGVWIRRLAELIAPRLRTDGGRLPPAMAAQQIAEAQIALVSNWLSQRPTTPAATIAEALLAMTRGLAASLA